MPWRRRLLVSAIVALIVVAVASTLSLTRPAVGNPIISAPSQLTVSARSTVAVFSWTGTADRYLIEVSTEPDFAAPLRIETTNTLATVNDLTPATAYLARVSAVTDTGSGPASEQVAFTTSESFRYSAPGLTLSSVDSTSLTATWTEVADGVSYQAELAADEAFTDPRSEVVTAPEATFSKLSKGDTYYVRVRVIDADKAPLSEWSASVSGTPLTTAPLTVGSYNILKARARNWSSRKPALVRTILGEDPDVVGLQEATPRKTASGRRQYADLTAALGADWALTDDNKDSTGEVRTVYNTTRLRLISDGHYVIAGSKKYGGFPRYITWAVFEQLSTEKQFIFVNTHFAPRDSRASDPHRVSAARQLVALLKRVNTTGLPVIIVGDFNIGINRTSSNRAYTAILAGGYRDPQATPSGTLGAAETKIRANLKTVNRYRRVAPRDSFQPLVDYVFVSPMRVKEWEVVARLNSSGRFVGTIPSDHNMLRVTVELP